jgi:hypothetical protein
MQSIGVQWENLINVIVIEMGRFCREFKGYWVSFEVRMVLRLGLNSD